MGGVERADLHPRSPLGYVKRPLAEGRFNLL